MFTESFKIIKDCRRGKNAETFEITSWSKDTARKLQILNSPAVWISDPKKLFILEDKQIACKTLPIGLFLF